MRLFMGLIKNIFTFPFRLNEKHKTNKYLKSIKLSQIDSLNGYDFEEYIATLFESCGFKCDKTPKSKDNGVDIIATKNNIKIAIQTKLYYNRKVGNKAIQEVYTGSKFHNCNIPMVVTNSFFSEPAKTVGASLSVVLFDRNVLEKVINSNSNDKKYIFDNVIYNYLIKSQK